MLSLIRKRMRGEKGFTLIELLVVIIIIAILAAIAIPTFLSQRTKAQDASAKSLVRNAMMSIESAYVDTRAFDSAAITDAVLIAGEPSIVFVETAGAGTIAPAAAPVADAQQNEVAWDGISATSYGAGTQSQSGKTFSIVVEKAAVGGGNTFYIDGVAQATDSW